MFFDILFILCFFVIPVIMQLTSAIIIFFSFKREQKERMRNFNIIKKQASYCLEQVTAIGKRAEKELGKLLSANNYVSNTKIPKQDQSQKHRKEEIFNA